jgi:hypothetical protein
MSGRLLVLLGTSHSAQQDESKPRTLLHFSIRPGSASPKDVGPLGRSRSEDTKLGTLPQPPHRARPTPCNPSSRPRFGRPGIMLALAGGDTDPDPVSTQTRPSGHATSYPSAPALILPCFKLPLGCGAPSLAALRTRGENSVLLTFAAELVSLSAAH